MKWPGTEICNWAITAQMKITEDGVVESLVRSGDKFSGIENAVYDYVIFFQVEITTLKRSYDKPQVI